MLFINNLADINFPGKLVVVQPRVFELEHKNKDR